MREPWFWRERSLAAATTTALLIPASIIYDSAQRLRAAVANPRKAPCPVICIGNATLGGSGKTPMALALRKLLSARGVCAHFASRGYGGSLTGPLRALPQHSAQEVGDEALLLAAEAPTWVSKNRAAGILAAARCADVVIVDAGFQNPKIEKDFSILLLRATRIENNGKIFPAGPFREPVTRALSRADAIVFVGDGEMPIKAVGTPTFRAARKMTLENPPSRAVAFCGIAEPQRFFGDLEKCGVTLAAAVTFPDHHPYSVADISSLRRSAVQFDAKLVTTEKDFVRLSPEARNYVRVAKLEMSLDRPDELIDLILGRIGKGG
jgi:tetraacyldisaccharide 4'-kinase